MDGWSAFSQYWIWESNLRGSRVEIDVNFVLWHIGIKNSQRSLCVLAILNRCLHTVLAFLCCALFHFCVAGFQWVGDSVMGWANYKKQFMSLKHFLPVICCTLPVTGVPV